LPNKPKRAKALVTPSASARDARGQPESVEDKKPVWRIGSLDKVGPAFRSGYGWESLDASGLEAMQRTLANFESMTWQEIEGKQSHFIGFESLSKEARDRLTELKLDDVGQVFSLRFTGRERLIGIRDRWIFRALWWDPEHLVCPSMKKHT
jgi:hypothetical protein